MLLTIREKVRKYLLQQICAITLTASNVEAIENTFKDLLRSLRQCNTPQVKDVKVDVTAGKTLEVKDFGD